MDCVSLAVISFASALPEPDCKDNCNMKWMTSAEYNDKIPVGGLSKFVCGYTGQQFNTSAELMTHLKGLMGIYFFNGHRAVRYVVYTMGKNTPINELFMAVKERLYKTYGKNYKALHTQYAKRRLLYFIENIVKLP
jgi:hypothetical protein